MASALYTVQFLCIQGVAPGERVSVNFNTDGTPTTFVIRDIASYCGNPSPVSPASWVLVMGRTDNGFPTSYSQNTGTTGSFQPIYRHDEVSLVSKNYAAETGELLVFYVVNTSQEVGTWDLHISGWCLLGEPGADILFSIP